MKKILLLLLVSIIPLGIFGQVAATDATPDTIPDGGSRKALRDANNWNILRNDVDRETFSSDSSKTATDTLASATGTTIKLEDDLETLLGGKLLNEATTSTNPSVIAHPNWKGTGLGGDDLGSLYLVESSTARLKLVHADGMYYMGAEQYFPDLGGSGTGTSIINYNRATGLLTYADQLSYTAGDGLTLAGSTFSLGDLTVTGDISFSNENSNKFYWEYYNTTGGDYYSVTTLDETQFDFQVYDDNLGTYAVNTTEVNTGVALFDLKLYNSDIMRFQVDPTYGFLITDLENQKGIEYQADYSANATARSLLDSAHIAALIALANDSVCRTLKTDTIDSNLESYITVAKDLRTILGGKLLNEAATLTNPTLAPHLDWLTSGIGGNASGDVAIIRGGVTRIQSDGTGNVLYSDIYIPNITGSGTGTSILHYNRSTGAVTYADAADSYSDSVVIDSVAHMLSDSICFPFGLGVGIDSDTILFVDGSYMGGWRNEQDTCVSLRLYYQAFGTSASVPFDILYADSTNHASPTVIFSGTATTVRDSTDVFTNKFIPRRNRIWAEQDGTSSGTPVRFEADFEVAYIRD